MKSVTTTRQQDSCLSTADLVASVHFDGFGRQVESRSDSDPQGVVKTLQEYDGLGRVERVSNPFRGAATSDWTVTAYDALGRVTSVTHPDGSDVSTNYSANITTVTDEAGKSRQSTSDALGRLVQVIEDPGALNYLTSYTYDALGNLKQVQQSGQTRTFTYDSLSRLRTAANPESGTNTYSYDDNGNLLTKLDARTITTQISYDGLNRPTVKTHTDGTPTVRYCYDGLDYDAVSGGCIGSQVMGKKGRLTASGSSVSVTRFAAFDDLGRITASQQGTAGGDYNFIYGYNKAGGLEVEQYPSGHQVETCYDAAGRVNGLTDLGDLSAYASAFSYAPHGALAQLTFGNNLVETTSFNNRLQPFRIQAGGLLALDFEYNTLGQADNNGNVLTQKIDAPGLPAILTQTYTYDGVNRLASITETGGATNWNRAYYYDAFGNRAAQGANVFANTPQCANSNDPGCSASDFDPLLNNRLTAAWASYDPAGNLTSFNKPGFEWTAAYDADNLQSSFTSGSTTTRYAYDGDGRRVKKLQGTRTTVFVYDAFGNLAAEYDTQPDPNLVAGTYFRTTDHLGSTRLVTDSSGAVVSRHDFFPFGEEIPANATFGNRQLVTDGNTFTTYNREYGVYQKFTAKERDAESELDYFGARYFGSSLGRFTTPDAPFMDQTPVDPQSWNLYAYVRNNPLRFIDSTGQAIQLLGATEEDRQKELAAIQASLVDSKVKDNLTITGNEKEGFFVGIKGKIIDFQRAGELEADLGALIASEDTVEFGFSKTYTTFGEKVPMALRGLPALFGQTYPIAKASGAVTNHGDLTASGNIQTLIDPTGLTDPQAARDGVPRSTLGEAVAHELLGHAPAHMQGIFGDPNDARAINAENRARARGGASRGAKGPHIKNRLLF